MIFGLFKKKAKKEVLVGQVIHFFPHVKAAVIKIKKGPLSLEDEVRIKGHTTNFDQKINSMEINHKPVKKATKGKEVAIMVKKKTRRKDKVYILRDE